MPSYFLPYPKANPTHIKKKQKPPPLETIAQKAKHPYPHPQPDPPNNPPSPLNLSPPSPTSPTSPISNSSRSPSSSSSSSTVKPNYTHQPWHQDYHPSILRLEIVCGDPRDPSFVVVFGLKFREGRRPKVRFSVKRGHGERRSVDRGYAKDREVEEVIGLGKHGEDERKERDGKGEARARKRKREDRR